MQVSQERGGAPRLQLPQGAQWPQQVPSLEHLQHLVGLRHVFREGQENEEDSVSLFYENFVTLHAFLSRTKINPRFYETFFLSKGKLLVAPLYYTRGLLL